MDLPDGGDECRQPRRDPRALAAALEQAERDRAQEAKERRRAGEDLTASQMLLSNAERRDRDAKEATQEPQRRRMTLRPPMGPTERRSRRHTRPVATGHEGEVTCDRAERREASASSLKGSVPDQEVNGRVLADNGNAKYPREAVTPPVGRLPRARKHAPKRARNATTAASPANRRLTKANAP